MRLISLFLLLAFVAPTPPPPGEVESFICLCEDPNCGEFAARYIERARALTIDETNGKTTVLRIEIVPCGKRGGVVIDNRSTRDIDSLKAKIHDLKLALGVAGWFEVCPKCGNEIAFGGHDKSCFFFPICHEAEKYLEREGVGDV